MDVPARAQQGAPDPARPEPVSPKPAPPGPTPPGPSPEPAQPEPAPLPEPVPPGPAPLPESMQAALDRFERHLGAERGLSPHTVRAYIGDVRSLLEHAA